MDEIQTHEFAKYAIDFDNLIFHETWNNPEGKMTVDEFKTIMLLHGSVIKENGLRKTLVYAQNLNFPIVPELQDWINKEYFMAPDKVAFVLPADFFERISLQQTMDDNERGKDDRDVTRYFDNEEEALAYLME